MKKNGENEEIQKNELTESNSEEVIKEEPNVEEIINKEEPAHLGTETTSEPASKKHSYLIPILIISCFSHCFCFS